MALSGRSGLRWRWRFADDFVGIVAGDQLWRPLLSLVLFSGAVRAPFKWSKVKGEGQQA